MYGIDNTIKGEPHLIPGAKSDPCFLTIPTSSIKQGTFQPHMVLYECESYTKLDTAIWSYVLLSKLGL